MTFGNYILRLRQRLQDLRTQSGTVISTISDNGIRWSANNLIEIANSSITQAVRLINQYSDSDIMKMLGRGFFEVTSSVVMTDGTGLIPTGVLTISSVHGGEGSGLRTFKPVLPDKYDEMVNDESQPRTDMWIYTIRYNLSLTQRRLYAQKGTSPATGSLSITGIYNKSDYGVADTAVEIFLQGIDDFLLDIGERECRDREHNWDRSQILDTRIAIKLGIKRQ